jgi:Uma2 family endonuclease
MTLEEFLAWEEKQAQRYEFDGAQPVSLVRRTDAHEAIVGNIWSALQQRLRDSRFRVFGSNLKVEMVGRVRYPDVFVVAQPLAPKQTVVTDPVVVFAVLREGGAHTDWSVKLAECRATPSVQRYIMLGQERIAAISLGRTHSDWETDMLLAGESLDIPEIAISIPLADLYDGVMMDGMTADADWTDAQYS